MVWRQHLQIDGLKTRTAPTERPIGSIEPDLESTNPVKKKKTRLRLCAVVLVFVLFHDWAEVSKHKLAHMAGKS